MRLHQRDNLERVQETTHSQQRPGTSPRRPEVDDKRGSRGRCRRSHVKQQLPRVTYRLSSIPTEIPPSSPPPKSKSQDRGPEQLNHTD